MIHQLRIYEIYEHNKVAFHERFQMHALRIWAQYGFNLAATWESQSGGHTEFIYLLEWPDEASMRAAWERFRADEKWIETKRLYSAKHGELVGKIEEKVLTPTSYSPNFNQQIGEDMTAGNQ